MGIPQECVEISFEVNKYSYVPPEVLPFGAGAAGARVMHHQVRRVVLDTCRGSRGYRVVDDCAANPGRSTRKGKARKKRKKKQLYHNEESVVRACVRACVKACIRACKRDCAHTTRTAAMCQCTADL